MNPLRVRVLLKFSTTCEGFALRLPYVRFRPAYIEGTLISKLFRCNYSSLAEVGVRFSPKKALVLTKLTRYEFEKHRNPTLVERELEEMLRKRGSDYNLLIHHHTVHKASESRVVSLLQDYGIEIRVVNRFTYSDDNVAWADVIFTTGGDGTFLLAASRIQDDDKPVIGINTDPTRSEGYLCLSKRYSLNVKEAVDKLLKGKFRWTYRKRIRVTLCGEQVHGPPIELHDQQLLYPELRFFDCLQEQHKSVVAQKDTVEMKKKRVLPVLALNEVYIGECLSARVSYYELSVDGSEMTKTKSSGLCVSTGTGSTSWTYNINKLTSQSVEELLKITEDESGYPLNSKFHLIDRITSRFNNSLILNPEESMMTYTIRDPIFTGIHPYSKDIKPRGLAKEMAIRSRCFDACLVIDGGLSFGFNDGMMAILELHDEDALQTVSIINE